MTNIENLRQHADEVIKGLEDLKNNTISEVDRKMRANELESDVDNVKHSIQLEIDRLKDKTDEKSKRKCDEVEALFKSFEESTKLYSSVLSSSKDGKLQTNEQLNDSGQKETKGISLESKKGITIADKTKGSVDQDKKASGKESEGMGIFSGDALNWGEKKQNINKIKDFVMNFNILKFNNLDSIYKDDEKRNIALTLLHYAGFNEINNESDFEVAINDFSDKRGVTGFFGICRALADNYYNVCLNEWIPLVYDESRNRRKNGEEDESASIKECVFACIEGLVNIGSIDENDLMNYQFIRDDLNNLGFRDLNDLKNYNNSDTIKALEYVKVYGEQAKQSSQSDGIKTEGLDGYIYAPGAYSKMLTKEYNYFKLAESSRGVLSLDDYNQLFCNFNQFRQRDIGDCYLISMIRGLARTQYFDTLMRTSIKKNSDGGYIVKLPLGEPEGECFYVSKSEIDNAGVVGSDGYKIIEVAFAHFCENRAIKSKEDLDNISGGLASDALSVILGREGYDSHNYKIPKDKEIVLQKLRNYNPERGDIISFSRPDSMGKDDVLPTGHRMLVTRVEKNQSGDVVGVQIENPWNNLHSMTYGDATQKDMTIDEFFDFAYRINCGSITEKFMNLDSSDYLPAQQSWDRGKYKFGRIGHDIEHIGEAMEPWSFDPSLEGVKNIPEAASDLLSPLGDGFKHLGEGIGNTGKSGYQYVKQGTKDALDWVGEKTGKIRKKIKR